jgi:hypothetical protein
MKLTRLALMAGLLVVPAFLMVGCQDQAAKRSSMDTNVQNAKMILADLKKTFAGGKIAEVADSRSGERDNRFGLMAMLIAEKIPYMVNKRVTDASKKAPLQAKLKETVDFIDTTLVPKFTAAQASKKPEDAKALVPLMDQLDKYLDDVNKLLP